MNDTQIHTEFLPGAHAFQNYLHVKAIRLHLPIAIFEPILHDIKYKEGLRIPCVFDLHVAYLKFSISVHFW